MQKCNRELFRKVLLRRGYVEAKCIFTREESIIPLSVIALVKQAKEDASTKFVDGYIFAREASFEEEGFYRVRGYLNPHKFGSFFIVHKIIGIPYFQQG